MQWGYTGCELDLEPKAFFWSLFWRSLGWEQRKSCAKVSLWQERCFPVDLCLSRSPLPYFFHGRERICRVSEPEITLFIPLPPCPTAFQSFQPHQSQFYFEYERGFERDFRACPSQIALWRVRSRGREAGFGSMMLWRRETGDYTGIQGVSLELDPCSSKPWTPDSVWWLSSWASMSVGLGREGRSVFIGAKKLGVLFQKDFVGESDMKGPSLLPCLTCELMWSLVIE